MPRRKLIPLRGGALAWPVGGWVRTRCHRSARRGARRVLCAAIPAILLLLAAHAAPALAQEDHVITTQASSAVRAEACNSSVDKAYNRCMIQGFFNIARVSCECTQSETPGLPTWECVATAICKK